MAADLNTKLEPVSVPKLSRDVMTSRLFHIRPDENLVAAWKLMRDKKIRHLPVINEDDDIVGILTDRDLQRAIHTVTNEKGELRYTIERFQPGEMVRHYMTTTVEFVTDDTPLETVAYRMLERKISSLLVATLPKPGLESEVIGIITTDDLLWALVRGLKADQGSPIRTALQTIALSPIGTIARVLSDSGI